MWQECSSSSSTCSSIRRSRPFRCVRTAGAHPSVASAIRDSNSSEASKKPREGAGGGAGGEREGEEMEARMDA